MEFVVYNEYWGWLDDIISVKSYKFCFIYLHLVGGSRSLDGFYCLLRNQIKKIKNCAWYFSYNWLSTENNEMSENYIDKVNQLAKQCTFYKTAATFQPPFT